MSQKSIALEKAIKPLRESYAAEFGTDWKHFHCPILFREDDVELCMGHVVSQGLHSSKKTVPQRKDVDNLFGKTVESHLIGCVKFFGLSASDALHDSEAGKFLKPGFEFQGETVESYFPTVRKNAAKPISKGDSDSLIELVDRQGQSRFLALKVPPEELASSGDSFVLHVEYKKSFGFSAIACAMHSAHLTMFRIFGYRYINSAGGLQIQNPLLAFFERCNGRKGIDIEGEAKGVFAEYCNVVLPLASQGELPLVGTVDDNRFLTVTDTTGKMLLLGVIVNLAGQLTVVWLPSGNSDGAAYYALMMDNRPEKISAHLTEFDDAGSNARFRVERTPVTLMQACSGFGPVFEQSG